MLKWKFLIICRFTEFGYINLGKIFLSKFLYSGFESAVLKFPQKPGKIYPIAPVSFVTFKSKADAQVAKQTGIFFS